MEEPTRQALRALPAVEELLNHPDAARLLEKYPRTQVVEAVRAVLEAARRQILEGAAESRAPQAPWAARHRQPACPVLKTCSPARPRCSRSGRCPGSARS